MMKIQMHLDGDMSGCPPIRALTFDVLGLVKVVQATAIGGSREGGVPKVVDRWGDPDSCKCVLAASIDDSKFDPLLAVARKCGSIDIAAAIFSKREISYYAQAPSLFTQKSQKWSPKEHIMKLGQILLSGYWLLEQNLFIIVYLNQVL